MFAAGGWVVGSPFGSAALWLAVWPVSTLCASASPRSRIVFNNFWGLSRRERCLDNPQKLLRAAWIGVMQKDWMNEGHCREVWSFPGRRCRARWVSGLVRPAGAVCCGGLGSWSRLLVPGGYASLANVDSLADMILGRHADVRCWTNRTGLPSPATARKPLDELERALNLLRHRHRPACHNTRHFRWYPVLLHHPDPGLL
jgi:hypothetical protein